MGLIQFMKNQIEKIKNFFRRKKNSSLSGGSQRIVIRSRNERHAPTPIVEPNITVNPINIESNNSDAPRITIRSVNRRTPIAAGGNVYSSEVSVQNANLGHGITVMRQRKPGRCPICATRGCVVENTGGGRHRWLCTEPSCGSTF
jgi:hypothetical protein